MTTTKPNTIPDKLEHRATLSAWLRCYPFMARYPKLLRGMPVSERCKALYPDIVQELYPQSRPMVVNLPVVQKLSKGIAA